jgi:riboflavin synthase
MFTGIIQEVGKVKDIRRSSSLVTIGIESDIVCNETGVSDSISINGVCLTVVKKQPRTLFFQAIASTILKTNLKHLNRNDFVNLESSLKASDKLGGHFVLGHVDIESKLRRCLKRADFWQLEVDLPAAFKRNIVANGSVALEGISLTVKNALPRSFTVDIIPFTYEHTNLKYKKIGSWLNVEFDYLLKAAK